MRPADVQNLRKVLKETGRLVEQARNALGEAVERVDAARALLEEAQSSLPYSAQMRPPKLRRIRYSRPEFLLYAACGRLKEAKWRLTQATRARSALWALERVLELVQTASAELCPWVTGRCRPCTRRAD